MPHESMFEKKFDSPRHPQRPEVQPLGHDPGNNRIKFVWCVLYLSNTKFGIKIFEIDFVFEIKWYFDLLTPL